MHLLVVSTSTVYGKPYLSYLQQEVINFFAGKKNILFVPYARPGGISHDKYTAKASEVFGSWGFMMRGAHEFASPEEAIEWAHGIFTGGGNTFFLLKTLIETGLFSQINKVVRMGMPYMGTSAGSNITGLTIGTTNDMPIIHPPTLQAFGWLPFNLNPHYLDPDPTSTHMGETREERIREFHFYNPQPVLGLREGSWLRVQNEVIELCGPHTARLFRAGQQPAEQEPGTIDVA
jgi:dipeptidase E